MPTQCKTQNIIYKDNNKPEYLMNFSHFFYCFVFFWMLNNLAVIWRILKILPIRQLFAHKWSQTIQLAPLNCCHSNGNMLSAITTMIAVATTTRYCLSFAPFCDIFAIPHRHRPKIVFSWFVCILLELPQTTTWNTIFQCTASFRCDVIVECVRPATIIPTTLRREGESEREKKMEENKLD